MTVVLVILAVLAIGGGWIGLPQLWGVPNLFEQWLERSSPARTIS